MPGIIVFRTLPYLHRTMNENNILDTWPSIIVVTKDNQRPPTALRIFETAVVVPDFN